MRTLSSLHQFIIRFFIIILVLGGLAILGCDSSTSQTPETSTVPGNNASSGNKISNTEWTTVEEGLEYRGVEIMVPTQDNSDESKSSSKKLVVVRIDPKQFNFEVALNSSNLQEAKSIEEIHQEHQASVSFNGAFFSEEFTPLGILVSGGDVLHPLSKADLMNGVFVIDTNDRAQLLYSSNNIAQQKYPFAIQNGPILLDSHKRIKITEDSGKKASRTAIGIDKKGHIVVILLQQSIFAMDNSLSLYEFAHILKEDPFFTEMGLHSVMNLDGGTSSGAIIGSDYFPEGVPVQNIIVVKHD